jgi:hypothetical protein
MGRQRLDCLREARNTLEYLINSIYNLRELSERQREAAFAKGLLGPALIHERYRAPRIPSASSRTIYRVVKTRKQFYEAGTAASNSIRTLE